MPSNTISWVRRASEDIVLAVQSEPLDGPVQRADHEDAERDDLDIGADLAGLACIEKKLVPVSRVGTPQRPMRFLQMLRQLAVDADIGGREVAGFQKRNKMGFDRQLDTPAVRRLTGSVHGGFHRLEDVTQAAIEHLVQNGFLGIEIVIDAAGLYPGGGRDLAQGRRRESLFVKQPGR